MLANIKNKTKGWIAYVIIGIIIVPFALFGIQDYIGGGSNADVAKVGGQSITRTEYLNLLEQFTRRAQEQLGDSYNQDIENRLKQQAISTLVDRKILDNIAKEFGFVVSDDEIKAGILNDQNFFKDGKFDLETYDRVLRLNGYVPSTYEQELLRNSARLQLRENLINASFLTEHEKQLIRDLLNEQRDISFENINYADFADKVNITDQEITDYYEQNKENFNTLEQIKINFIRLKGADLMAEIEPTDADILELYELEKANFKSDEERDASHILVEEESLAQEIKDKANADNFADLAKQYSVGPSSENGGNLGFFTRGVMVPNFEDVVFNMQVGEVSDVVKTEFGYHIIKLNAINKSKTKTLEEARDDLIAAYKKNKATEQMFELTDKLQNLAYEQGLEIAAEELGLDIQVSDFLTAASTEFSPRVLLQAFNEEVIKNNITAVVELGNNDVIAFNKNEFLPKRAKTLAEATAEIKEILTTEKSRELAEQKAASLIQGEAELSQKIGFVYRDVTDPETSGIVNFAFGMPKNTNYGFFDNGQSIVVVGVFGSKVVPDPANEDMSVFDQEYADQLFQDIFAYTKKITDIKVYNNLL